MTAALSKKGIGKGKRNQQQNFMYRGIDDVYQALSTLVAENKLTIIPYTHSRGSDEYESKGGGRMVNVVVDVEYTITSAEDGSYTKARVFGEAMDAADKATGKAYSMAYKTMAFQVFCIPVQGEDNDADAHSPQIQPRQAQAPRQQQATAPREPRPQQQQQAAAPPSHGHVAWGWGPVKWPEDKYFNQGHTAAQPGSIRNMLIAKDQAYESIDPHMLVGVVARAFKIENTTSFAAYKITIELLSGGHNAATSAIQETIAIAAEQ